MFICQGFVLLFPSAFFSGFGYSFNYYHFTPNIIHLFKLLVKAFIFPFRLPFKVVGGFGIGFTANPISIIYTNIIHLFKLFVKAFNFSFPSAVVFALACLNSFLILILYHNGQILSSTFFIGVRLPFGLGSMCFLFPFFILILYTFYI